MQDHTIAIQGREKKSQVATAMGDIITFTCPAQLVFLSLFRRSPPLSLYKCPET